MPSRPSRQDVSKRTYSYHTLPSFANKIQAAPDIVYGVLLAEAKTHTLWRGLCGGYVASPDFPVHTFRPCPDQTSRVQPGDVQFFKDECTPHPTSHGPAMI